MPPARFQRVRIKSSDQIETERKRQCSICGPNRTLHATRMQDKCEVPFGRLETP